jgi:hypothetical protein
MAPTTVTVESVTTPIAVSRQANVRNSTNVTLRVASSRVRPISSAQITASAGSPTASSSASWALLESLVGLAGEHGVEDLEADRAAVMDFRAFKCLITSSAHSRAMLAAISSPGGSRATPGYSKTFATTTSCCSTRSRRHAGSAGAITRKCSTRAE